MAAAIKMLHERDPADEIREKVGDLKGVNLFFNAVLVGVYVRPNKTAGGIILSDKTRSEDIYQGKIGLVLALGPRAFQSDDKVTFDSAEEVKVGDWVLFRPADTWSLSINDHDCRLVSDVSIKGKVASPDMVW